MLFVGGEEEMTHMLIKMLVKNADKMVTDTRALSSYSSEIFPKRGLG